MAGVENIKDAETVVENVDSRSPWRAETLDDVSIISDDVESDGSWRDARPRKGTKRLLRRISQKAGHARHRLIAVRQRKAMKMSESKKSKEGECQTDCTLEKLVDQRRTLGEKSKYDELEAWVAGLGAPTPILQPRPSRNFMSAYGSSRVIDLKVGNADP